MVSIPYSSGLGLELGDADATLTAAQMESLNPLFIRSRFGTTAYRLGYLLFTSHGVSIPYSSGLGLELVSEKMKPCGCWQKGLNPLFIRSRFGTGGK